ncbi:MAG TPA: hypothetical protein DC034_08030 [Clostridium sp.]|jgi:hypothetical protein|nr:hypothetical protein [Clostridium sp.]
MEKNKHIFNLIFLISECVSFILFLYVKNNMVNNKLLIISLFLEYPVEFIYLLMNIFNTKNLRETYLKENNI